MTRHSPPEGLVHRYPDRVLVKLVSVCSVYCRFCFRRETVGHKGKAFLSPHRARSRARLCRCEARHLGGDLQRRRPLYPVVATDRARWSRASRRSLT